MTQYNECEVRKVPSGEEYLKFKPVIIVERNHEEIGQLLDAVGYVADKSINADTRYVPKDA